MGVVALLGVWCSASRQAALPRVGSVFDVLLASWWGVMWRPVRPGCSGTRPSSRRAGATSTG
jgi:hypothetical protein